MKNSIMIMLSMAALTAAVAMVSGETNAVPTNAVVVATASTNNLTVTTNTLVATNMAASEALVPDPQVGKVLMGMAAYLQGAKSFKCSVSLQVNTEMEGMKQEISAVYELAAEKPNRLALRYVKGMTGNTVVCNGKKLYIYALSLNRFEEREAPKLVEQLAEGVGPMAGNMLFVDNLLVNDIYAAIMDGVSSATYVGKERVDGVDCEHVRFVQEQFDWDLWVSSGPKPVVIQVLSDMAKSFSGLSGEVSPPKGMKMVVLNRFTGWVVDGVLPADTFEFVPPPGAHKIDSLFEGEDEKGVEMPAPSVMKEKNDPKVVEKIESRE
jgi:hypothetical protein